MLGKSNTTHYYQVLDVSPAASPKEIKAAYKRLALRYHPDKRTMSDSQADDIFKEIGVAYGVLSDPKKRMVYDKHGPDGVRLYEEGLFGPDGEYLKFLPLFSNPVFLISIFCSIPIIPLLFVIFLSLQVDHIVSWSWGVVLLPLWVLNFFVAIFIVVNLYFGIKEKEYAEPIALAVKSTLVLAFEILLTLNLERTRSDEEKLDWTQVFIPIFIFELIHIVEEILSCTPSSFKDSEQHNFLCGLGLPCYRFKKIWTETVRLLMIILLVTKLDGGDFSWFVVSIPFFLYLLGLSWSRFLSEIEHCLQSPTSTEESVPSVCLCSCWGCCSMMIGTVLLSLIFAKADGLDIETFEVFIPVFVILGLLCLICAILIPCGILAGKVLPKEDESSSVWSPYESSPSSRTTTQQFSQSQPTVILEDEEDTRLVPDNTHTVLADDNLISGFGDVD